MLDGVRRAGLDAQAATGAGLVVDGDEGQFDLAPRGLDRLFAAVDVDRRAADLDAVAAAGALVLLDQIRPCLLYTSRCV